MICQEGKNINESDVSAEYAKKTGVLERRK